MLHLVKLEHIVFPKAADVCSELPTEVRRELSRLKGGVAVLGGLFIGQKWWVFTCIDVSRGVVFNFIFFFALRGADN